MTAFSFTAKQREAKQLIGGEASHCMLFGGSRSGKTFLNMYGTSFRALAAPKSRHAVMRFRFNAVKTSVVFDTFPKVMDLCFPGVAYHIDKTDWFAEFENGSQIFFGGLDDKERTEKILGMEFATIFFNECSQIPFSSRSMAITRLAQKCEWKTKDGSGILRLKALYDCNPPSMAHWTYKLFIQKRDPDTNENLPNVNDYISLRINPRDNETNLPAEYIAALEALPARMRLRFLDGQFGDVTSNALWTLESIETWRTSGKIPDMQRIIVAVDPSGAGDTDNLENDAIGIVVAGLGSDGNGYILEDLTMKAGPAVWGKVVVNAYERWNADLVVAETNYGGAMVAYVVKAAGSGVSFKEVTASRGKVVRAEPISMLAEQGKVRHVGRFNDLEDELCAFTTAGFLGGKSPNRADAYVWALTELFPGLTRKADKKPFDLGIQHKQLNLGPGNGAGWLGM